MVVSSERHRLNGSSTKNFGVGWACLEARCQQNYPDSHLLCWIWENAMEISWVKIKTGKLLTYYHYMPNQLDLGKIFLLKSNNYSNAWALYGLQLLSGDIDLLWLGFPMSCSVEICLTMAISKDYSSVLALLSGHPLQFLFPGLCACRAVSFIFPHSSPLASVAQQVLPFLKYVIKEVPQMSMMSSALSSGGSILESPESVSVWYENNYWCHLTNAITAAPWILLLNIGKIATSFSMLKQQAI